LEPRLPQPQVSREDGLMVALEEGSWNVFAHSHPLVNIPESQSWERLPDGQVQKAVTLGSFSALLRDCGSSETGCKWFP
jgi:hypothetical protein